MSQVQPQYTALEYLRLERAADYKSEFVNGQIYAMSGASREHNLIAGNVFGEIRTQLRGRPCEAYVNDMRVKISATGMYAYPDVVAVCGEPHFEDEHVDTLTNPTLIVEVLSPSTEGYDRGAKAAHYRRIESLQEYLFIAQDRISVEHFVRDGDHWALYEASDLNAVVHLPSVGCDLPLSEVYDKVDFPDGEGAETA